MYIWFHINCVTSAPCCCLVSCAIRSCGLPTLSTKKMLLWGLHLKQLQLLLNPLSAPQFLPSQTNKHQPDTTTHIVSFLQNPKTKPAPHSQTRVFSSSTPHQTPTLCHSASCTVFDSRRYRASHTSSLSRLRHCTTLFPNTQYIKITTPNLRNVSPARA